MLKDEHSRGWLPPLFFNQEEQMRCTSTLYQYCELCCLNTAAAMHTLAASDPAAC